MPSVGAYYMAENTPILLCPSKVIATHSVRLRRFSHLYQIRMDEGGIATPVFRRGIRKHDLGHLPRHLQACQRESVALLQDQFGACQ